MLRPSNQDGWDALAAAVVAAHPLAGTDWLEHRRHVQLGLYDIPDAPEPDFGPEPYPEESVLTW